MTFPFSVIDLTHDLSSAVPTWDGDCGFSHSIEQDYADCTTETVFRVQHIKMQAGVGTHMDAPRHFVKDGLSINDLPIDYFCHTEVALLEIPKGPAEGIYKEDLEPFADILSKVSFVKSI